MINPVVSVIIPTFNRASLIRETLDSVLDQTYSNWECIVVDDGSRDNTEELVNSYSKKDKRIKFYHRPKQRPKGASSCRNVGLERSSGDYVQFLDSDDIISKEKLSSQIKLLEKSPFNSIATCKWGTFERDLSKCNLHKQLKAYNNFEKPFNFIEAMGESICYFPIHAYLIRKSIITKAGQWNEFLSLNDDGEFMMRVILNSNAICFSKDATAFYRLPGNDNLSIFQNKTKIRDAIYSWELIENYLKIRFKQAEFNFIKRAKWDFYQHAKAFPNMIKENRIFFSEQLKRDVNWFKRF